MATAHLKAQGDLEAANLQAKASTALQQAQRTVSFLVHPDSSNAPARRRTRALLRSLRYIGVFLFWRLFRYAKYAAVGAITAAIAGTAIGSIASGAAFVVAPPGIFAGAGVGLVWGLGKFGWRVLARRVWHGETHDADPRADEQSGHHVKEEIRPPRADPW